MFDRNCIIPSEFIPSSDNDGAVSRNIEYEDYIDDLVRRMRKSAAIAASNTEEAKEKSKLVYDRNINPVEFNVGERVLLSGTTVRQGRSAKLGQNMQGPYEVVEKVGDTNYKIKMGREISEVHGNRLKRYHEIMKSD